MENPFLDIGYTLVYTSGMKTILQKWGNSQGVRLPKVLIEPLGLTPGTEVDLMVSADAESIVIRRSERSRSVRGRYRIEDLVSRMPPDSETTEFEWGKAVGKELW